VLTDQEVRKKILIDAAYDQRLETASRKIDFVLSGIDRPNQKAQLDVIKSHMVINVLNYCINQEYLTHSRLRYLLSFYYDTLRLPIVSSQPLVRHNISYALLKLVYRCLENDNLFLLSSTLQLSNLKETVEAFSDHLLLKVVNFIAFILDPEGQNIQGAQIKFQDPVLETLRLDVMDILLKDKDLVLVQQLTYKFSDVKSLPQWLRKVKQTMDSSRSSSYMLMLSLGNFVCMNSGSYDHFSNACSQCGTCDLDQKIDYERPNISTNSDSEAAWGVFLKLITRLYSPDVVLEMVALMTIHKFFVHYQPPKITPNCPTFNFLKKLLSSANRNVRLLAVRTMSLYIISKHNVYESNTNYIIKVANSLKIDSHPHLVESTIMIWGQLAISTDGVGVHPILLKLIDFLASHDSFRSSMAFHEIEMIALAKNKTPWKLLSLVLPSLSLTIVQKLTTKPAMAQRISDLVGVPINQILWRYQSYTVPYLLTYYKKDLIAEIAATREGKSKLELLLANKAKIFAFLLISLPDPSESKIHGILSNVCPEISKTSLSAICGSPLSSIWELLKMYSNDGKNDEVITKSIGFLLQLTTPDVPEKQRVSTFFQKNTLGIVNLFTDVIRDTRGSQPFDEKLRSFCAIELLVQISSSFIVSALPQIYTCLQSTLEVSLLREATLKCWKALVHHLEEVHLITLLDQSIATMVQQWDNFDHRCKLEARKLIGEFLEKSDSFRLKHIYTFYSLADNDDLAEMYAKVFNSIQKADRPHALLVEITRRCKHDNKFVVSQALVDLSRFLNQYYQEFYHVYLAKPSFALMVSNLLGALLDILNKFKVNDDVTIQCSKCLGQIGALDPAKFEVEKKRDQMIIASNFAQQGETVGFILRFLSDYLVPAFWASEDPTKQVFLAYAMQEFLKFAGLDSTRFDLKNPDLNSHEYMLWSQFTDIAKSTLTPLVSSKYTASVSKYTPLSYPIFDITWEHSKWLRYLTLDLLKRGTQSQVAEIFTTCSSLVKEQDISFCSFLLPYAALNVVITNDNGKSMTDIKSEIMKVLTTDIETVHHLAVDSLKLSYETIFNLLEYFRKWIFSRKQFLKRKGIKKEDPSIRLVAELLESIPQQLMAKISVQASSYERAVFYLEQCHRSENLNSFGDSFFGSLQSMYANIGDYDALDGVLKQFSTKSLEDRITELEYSDNWRMAQDCFKALGEINSENTTIDPDTRLLKSLFEHSLYDQALDKLDQLLNLDNKNMKKDWLDIGVEASILSGKRDHLTKWVSQLELNGGLADFGNLVYYHIGKSLLTPKKDLESFQKSLDNAYLLLASELGVDRRASLRRNRSQFVLLHSLTDMDAIICQRSTNFTNLKNLMDLRLLNCGNDFKSNWILSSVRRAANASAGGSFNLEDIGDSWLSSSKSARKHNRIDLATSSIIHSIGMKNPSTDLEYSKLLWAQGDHTRALAFIEDLKTQGNIEDKTKAVIQLKYTKWLDISNNSNSTKILEEYNRAIKLDPAWEKPYYALGKYYNKLLDVKIKRSETAEPKDISGELERRTINFYLKALYCGTKYLYEALPKVVTVWLDFAEDIDRVPYELHDSMKVTVLHERKKHLTNILEDIQKSAEKLPAYFWYTVFSQLLSRILHSHRNTGQLIIVIAQLVVNEYPSHSLWSVLAQYKSIQKERERRAKKILDLFVSSDSKDTTVSNAKLFEKSKKLFNELISVSKKKIAKKGSLSLQDDFDFDHSATPSPLVVPVKSNFDITLPSSVQALRNHNAFPSSSRITIARFENKVDVLSSMQQPRHLYIKGSNGMNYGILCKPNDDLRKDAKLMEFTTMIDHLLKKDYDSEQRKLHIKTYAVIPLNENYGIIEWVDHSRTMRDILKIHYSNININLDVPVIRKVLDMDCEVVEKANAFKSKILSKYPPVLYNWFIENFPDPSSWYDARNNYTRTTAVMSMVGYMLGLGDRHGENILFNEKDGGILHVDFDCLFEKGLELSVPERVPFRLTQNMVDAFGITGVEGTFRKSCEVALSLIRGNETTLMNILESFLHDPIMDWSQKRKTKNTPQAALSTIRRKIRGILDKEGLPMSVPGQAEFLIQQATSLENLCQMYIGWMAFW
jgi:cell cycle checkpoint protein MEC1